MLRPLVSLICVGLIAPAIARAEGTHASAPAPSCDSIGAPVTGSAPSKVSAHVVGLREACVSDSWPVSVVTCFTSANGPKAERACATQLDEGRQDWLRYRIGKAEGRKPGWACTEAEAVLREGERCWRVELSPIPEMRRALKEIRASVKAKKGKTDINTQRTAELRCVSMQRLASKHILEAPCKPAAPRP